MDSTTPAGTVTAASALPPRQHAILQAAEREGYVAIDELARALQVTTQTIRRDIRQLCEQNLLRRYHGGAGLPSTAENVAYSARQVLLPDEKRRIARLVADHIPNHASLFINIGTTTEAVARELRHHQGLRIVTNNLNVAALLSKNEDLEVIVAGGVVRARDRGIVGEAAMEFVRQFKVDFGIIGISGIDADGTLLDFDYREVRIARTIITHSRNVLLVADHSKFGRAAMVQLGHLSEIDVLFTDRPPPAVLQPILAGAGTRVYVA